MKKFDIFRLNLDPKKGHAQAGIRPGVIIQSNAFNPYSSTVIIVPLTTKKNKIFPSEFIIKPSSQNGLKKTSRFLGSQIVTVDKRFLLEKLGSLEEKYFPLLKEALGIVLDLDDYFVTIQGGG